MNRCAAFLVVSCACLLQPAAAQDGTWTATGGGSWTGSGNWSGGIIATGTDYTADFSTLDIPGDTTVTLDADWTIGDLRLGDTSGANNWILAAGSPAGTLTLDVTAGRPEITINNNLAAFDAALTGSDGFAKLGAGRLALRAAGSVTGAIHVLNGILELSGAGTILDHAAGITVHGTGQKVAFPGFGGAPQMRTGALYLLGDVTTQERLGSTPITLRGGELAYYRYTASQPEPYVLSNVTAAAGLNTFGTAPNSGGTMLVSNLTRSVGATIDFKSYYGNLGDGGDNGRVTIGAYNGGAVSNDVGGILGGWAIAFNSGAIWDSYWASYDPVTGARPYSGGYVGSLTASTSPTDNVLHNGGSETITADKTVNSLISLNGDQIINDGATLTLASGGLIVGYGNHWIKTGNSGYLTSGQPGGELFAHVYDGPGDANRDWQINGVSIKDNGATAVKLIKSGPGYLRINSANTFSGGTYVNDGWLVFYGSQAFNRVPSGSMITINGGGNVLYGDVNVLPTVQFTIEAGGQLAAPTWQDHGHFGNLFLNGGTISKPSGNNYNGEDFQLNGNVTVGGLVPSTISLANGLGLNGDRTFTVADVTGDNRADLVLGGAAAGGILQNNDGGAGDGFIKEGAGTMRIDAATTHSGNTTINAGTVKLGASGTLGSTPLITLASGAGLDVSDVAGFTLGGGQTLQGGGAVTGTVSTSAGTIVRPGGSASAGTLTFKNDLVLNGVTLPFDLTSATTVGGGTNDLLQVDGTLALNNDTVVINPLGALNGTYRLVNYGGSLGGTFNPTVQAPPSRKTLTLDYSVTNQINLNVSGSPYALKWTSTGSADWDVNLSANWVDLPASNSFTFYNDDSVQFDDEPGVVQTINVTTAVYPSGMLVATDTNAFTFTGTGALAGYNGLTKLGTNLLVLATTNTFTGPVLISQGIVRAAAYRALGNASGITVANGAQLDLNGVAQGAYQQSFTVSGAGPDGRGAILSSGNAIYGNASSVSNLTLSGHATVGSYRTTGDQGRWDIGTGGGRIDGGGFSLTKVGNSMLVIRGVTTNLAGLVINEGLVYSEDIDHNIGTSVTVNATGILAAYNGRNNGAAITLNGGQLASVGANMSTWSGPVTVAADSLVNGDAGYGYGGGDVRISGALAGAGNLSIQGVSALEVTANNDATWTGAFTIGAGAGLRLTGSGTLGSQTVTNDGTLRFARSSSYIVTNSIAGSGTVQHAPSAATVTLLGVNTMANLSYGGDGIADGLVLAGNSSNVANYCGSDFTANRGLLVVRDSAYLSAASMFVGEQNGKAGEVRQFGGTVVARGANQSFRIGHWAAESSLYLIGGGLLDATSGGIEVGWDGTGTLSITGGLVRAKYIQIDGNGATAGQDALILSGGRLEMGGLINRDAADSLVQLGGGTLASYATWNSGVPMELTGINGDVAIETTGGDSELSGALTGSGGFAKTGTGTLTLSGASAYSGATVVKAGRLLVQGSLGGTGQLMVASGATLGGTGWIGGAVSSTGAVSPGASAGLLTISNDYTQAAGGSLVIEIGGTTPGVDQDQLVVSGTASLAGTLDVTNTIAVSSGDSFTVLQAAAISGTFGTILGTPGPGLTWQAQYTATSVVVQATSGASGFDAFVLTHNLTQGLTGDDDGDGCANLLEYALGSDPTNGASKALTSGAQAAGQLNLTFLRLDAATDVTYFAESAYAATNDADWVAIASNKLGTWYGPATFGEVALGGGTNRATVTDTVTGATNRFMRLRVSRP